MILWFNWRVAVNADSDDDFVIFLNSLELADSMRSSNVFLSGYCPYLKQRFRNPLI